MQNREELVTRARGEAARITQRQATERRCPGCGGRGKESRVRCARSATGFDVHTPCLSCDGFGMYWQVRTDVPVLTVTKLLGLDPPARDDPHAKH